MSRTIHKTEQPVILEGYQAVLKPSKFGYSLSAIVDSEIVDALETDREESLQWAQGKLKNPKRSVLKPEPWEEVAEGQFPLPSIRRGGNPLTASTRDPRRGFQDRTGQT